MKVAQHQEVSAEVELREQVIFCVNLFTGELVHTFPGEYRPGFHLKGFALIVSESAVCFYVRHKVCALP